MALTCLKGGTECGNNRVKKLIYSAPAVKGVTKPHGAANGTHDLNEKIPGTYTQCYFSPPTYSHSWRFGAVDTYLYSNSFRTLRRHSQIIT